MSLILVPPYRKTGPTEIVGRVFRLVAIGGTREAVGVYEFELYDASNVNLCRDSATIPTTTAGPAGLIFGSNYPPSKSIDGNTTNWTETCYIAPRADGTSYIEYTFPKDISPKRWRMMPEGSYLPTPLGMKLLMKRGDQWLDVTGTSPAGNTAWASAGWREFTMPTKI